MSAYTNIDIPQATGEPDLRGLSTDPRGPARLGWWVVIGGLGLFALWSALAPLDKGVPLSGTVTVAGNRKAVQHLTGGTVEAILVKEGDTVQEGDPLVRMNSVHQKANADALRAQYLVARATMARLVAERDGLRSIAFPPELAEMGDDARVVAAMRSQTQLFTMRLAALQSELAALDESVAASQQQIRGHADSREGKQAQLKLVREQLDAAKELAAQGFMPRTRVLELERTHSELQTAIGEESSSMARGERQVAELRMRRLQRVQEHQKEVSAHMSEAQKEADGVGSKLVALDHDLANVVVRAPAGGTVVSMNIFTQGGVVPPGHRLMDIVPSDEPLMVEGQLPVHLVDKVHPDLPVNLIFSAFNQNVTPQVPGLLTQVSADRLTDERTGMPYYSVKAVVAPEGRKVLADLKVRPGMPVDMFVKTGERTFANYLFKPVLDHVRMALRED
ncbi:HlyD family type I secretion periplasmic adaptor subunit [Ramlibacter sp. Leaf400]|uniref:HlyD family type I secretion periplasmic adaptor subunit n=1 Tax=Ramlibacter sp. Leaf400 TaxID=1736365 RepID=UPI0006FCF214|nr:HlyD family type I secretion periplasmic adaptor subunit [Ramlibacter sp. Leaf400]KQT09617.1 hemolysin D [Ramlibacter sp. Leaf400]